MKWDKKRKKAYARCLDGLRKASILGNRVRFLTLTTPACNGENLDNDNKRKLIQLLWRLLYFRIKDSVCYNIDAYFSVRTSEGNGVIHVVFTGDYIDFEWLQEEWVKINGSNFIWICDPYKYFKDDKSVARYFVSQYIGVCQPDDFVYGFSHNWIYPGFIKDFKECKKCSCDYSVEPVYIDYYGYPHFKVDYVKLYDKWFDWIEDKVLMHRYNEVWEIF